MIRYLLLAAFVAQSLTCAGQPRPQEQLSEQEEQHLRQVLSEGSSSPVDLIHALETHLAKFPESPKKHDIERGILKAAIQSNDTQRIATYGERVLKQEPDDVTILDPICRALVLSGDRERVKSGLDWAKHYETLVRGVIKEMPADISDRGRRRDELDRMLSRALFFQSIALGVLGDNKTGAAVARQSFDIYPSVDPALELGRRLAALGQAEDAIRAYADAFTIADSKATDTDRVEIRRRLGQLYQKVHGSEAGLGDVVLQAYDRNTARLAERRIALKQFDPNLGATNPLDFTLNGAHGEKLALSSLLGKIIVMDFWATWCGPCRVQHPLYEKVKQHFANNPEVVFVAIDTDDEREPVKQFVEEQGWKNAVYYEDGLARSLRVSSIPATIIFGKNGSIVSRMNGFDPKTFVDVLTARITEALEQPVAAK